MPELRNTRTRKISERYRPVSGMTWLSRVEEAYKARNRFFDLKKIQQLRIIETELRTQINPEHIEIKPSNSGPTINVFIRSNANIDGAASSIIRKQIGKLYFNFIFGKNETYNNYIQRHEEEHNFVELNAHVPKKVQSIDGIRVNLQSEIAGQLHKYALFADFDKDIFYEDIRFYLSKFIRNLRKNRKDYNEEKLRLIYDTLDKELHEITNEIAQNIYNDRLTILEIIDVMKRTSWESLPKALKERADIKRYYMLKRKAKQK